MRESKNKKSIILIFSSMLLLTLFSCRPVVKEVPSGSGIHAENVFTDPSFDHGGVTNVYLLPLANPRGNPYIERQKAEIVKILMRNLNKFHYFNIQTDKEYPEDAEVVVEMETNRINRVSLGALGEEYNAEALLKVSISEYRPFFPLVIALKAKLINAESGKTIWSFDQVFDTNDTDVVNAMRIWWNTRMAGGDDSNRFELNKLRPSFFMNFVFYTMAESYGTSRIDNVSNIEAYMKKDKKSKELLKKKQSWVY